MIISFPQQVPAHCGRSLMLIFPTVVDGERIERRVSAEALGDHFGAASLREEDLLAAFEAHRDKIEGAARRLLANNWIYPCTRTSRNHLAHVTPRRMLNLRAAPHSYQQLRLRVHSDLPAQRVTQFVCFDGLIQIRRGKSVQDAC
jgi:hypothetical protein